MICHGVVPKNRMDASHVGLVSGRCCIFHCWPLQTQHGLQLPAIRRSQRSPSLAKVSLAASTSQMDHEHSGELLQPSSDAFFGRPTDKTELLALRENATHARLLRKLSEANQYGRHLQRQFQEKEQALIECKNELAVMELEFKALLHLAQEVAQQNVMPGARKIDGKYIQSHLALRLEEIHERLLLRVKDVDAVCYRDVPLVWYGIAEDVKVMGSFDGWTRGEQMSPESFGTSTKFSTVLKLPPGRYELKFLVDGEWQLSPEWPTVGEAPVANNLLLVK